MILCSVIYLEMLLHLCPLTIAMCLATDTTASDPLRSSPSYDAYQTLTDALRLEGGDTVAIPGIVCVFEKFDVGSSRVIRIYATP